MSEIRRIARSNERGSISQADAQWLVREVDALASRAVENALLRYRAEAADDLALLEWKARAEAAEAETALLREALAYYVDLPDGLGKYARAALAREAK